MKLGLGMYLGWHPTLSQSALSLPHLTNHQYDLINSAVEFGCWFPCVLSCWAMYKEKDVRGNSVIGQLYYTVCALWNFGSFYLWGDVPALMPQAMRAVKALGMNWSDQTKRGQDFTRLAGEHAIKNAGGSWFKIGSPGQKVTNQNPVHELSGLKIPSQSGRRTDVGKGARFTSQDCGIENRSDGVKGVGIGSASWHDKERLHPNDPRNFWSTGTKQKGSGREWFAGDGTIGKTTSSKSPARKAASAMIAKIPFPLSRHIAKTYYPFQQAAE